MNRKTNKRQRELNKKEFNIFSKAIGEVPFDWLETIGDDKNYEEINELEELCREFVQESGKKLRMLKKKLKLKGNYWFD